MLRGGAVLLVVVRHWPKDAAEPAVLRALQDLGWVGVDLFFVLSGYLISTLLYQELDGAGRLNLARFWLRRGLRIWPAYFAAFLGTIVLGGAYAAIRGRGWALPADQWPNLLLIQNYFPHDVRWLHTWSLAIEEHFYLALPLILTFFGRRRIPALGLAFCLLCLVLRIVAVWRGAGWEDIYYPTHLRFDALMVGVLVGYACRYHPAAAQAARRRWPTILTFCAGVILLTAFNPLETSVFTNTVGFTLLDCAFGGVVLLAATARGAGGKWLAGRLLAAVGTYSYTIYLAHGAMVDLPRYQSLIRWAEAHGGVAGARLAFVLMAVGGGLLLSWLVEQPALRLRQRLTAARPVTAGAPAWV